MMDTKVLVEDMQGEQTTGGADKVLPQIYIYPQTMSGFFGAKLLYEAIYPSPIN